MKIIRTFAILALLLTVMAHHVAASQPVGVPGDHAALAGSHHSQPAACSGADCRGGNHVVPGCCAMGLCLSCLPGAGLAKLLGGGNDHPVAHRRDVLPRSIRIGLDRPPKLA